MSYIRYKAQDNCSINLFFNLLKSKNDSNRSCLFRKAAGLGYTDIAREILERYPETVAAQDNEGKTALHYAAALKDDGVMYDLLTEYGADESKLDNVSDYLQKKIIANKIKS